MGINLTGISLRKLHLVSLQTEIIKSHSRSARATQLKSSAHPAAILRGSVWDRWWEQGILLVL